MTDEQRLYFTLGAIYAYSKDMKNSGCFEDLKLNDVVNILIKELVNKNK